MKENKDDTSPFCGLTEEDYQEAFREQFTVDFMMDNIEMTNWTGNLPGYDMAEASLTSEHTGEDKNPWEKLMIWLVFASAFIALLFFFLVLFGILDIAFSFL